MNLRVFLHPKAARVLSNMDQSLRERVRQHLKELEDSPEKKGERLAHSPFWKLSVGDYRVIYEIDRAAGRVIVLFIGHRRDIYDDLGRLV